MPTAAQSPIDPHRYRRLRRFVLRTLLAAFWHDFLLSRPFLRLFRTPPLPRWLKVARRYRELAVEMGGVLIKMGQFLSSRVDVLPLEITRELAGLQDEVPPEPFAAVEAQIEEDFGGRPLAELFARFDRQPMGAASLAQVHTARLLPEDLDDGSEAGFENGEVVVKVLRPGIGTLVETDLAALRLAVRWLKPWKRLRRRVDLDRLADEISNTTRAELDLPAEGRNVEHFAHDFEDDPQVRVPHVFWQRTRERTLTLENVAFVKIGDTEALEAAGISRPAVAKTLYQTYMRQVFVHSFVHADPHPGNLFVRPMAEAEAEAAGVEVAEGVPFELVFVDFGMVAVVPMRLRTALREVLIGLGTRDGERVVHALRTAGVLLPGADPQRLVELHDEVFGRLWGVSLGEMKEMAYTEARHFLREYRDVLFQMPFQAPVDLVFVMRAVGILGGLATSLDEEFDPWAETAPFAEEMARAELAPGLGALGKVMAEQARLALRLPERLEGFLTRSERGTLSVQTQLTPEVRKTFERLERTGRRLVWTLTAGALFLGAVALRAVSPADPLAGWLFAAAGVSFAWGWLRGR
ncbi:MAG TPA: AarF/UbiB family protein [Thermoanaerobaculia bacterium]|nr:AarF/UbiB family protein [Thermoanaerobaculia bacterium]